jgi:Lon protease-like protein
MMTKNYSLPLFPLHSIICPGGLMRLRIFEPRYLDMVKNCLRNNSAFCLVAAAPDNKLPFASIGTVMKISHADVTTAGLMMIDCIGQHRIKIHSYSQQADGLLIGDISDIANDCEIAIPDDLQILSTRLQNLIESFADQGVSPSDIPIVKPYQYHDAAWVANRWVELLELALLEKQRLMQLDSPIVRLELLHDLLDLP